MVIHVSLDHYDEGIALRDTDSERAIKLLRFASDLDEIPLKDTLLCTGFSSLAKTTRNICDRSAGTLATKRSTLFCSFSRSCASHSRGEHQKVAETIATSLADMPGKMKEVSVEELLNGHSIIDVRSPIEYERSHSRERIPLFSDEERSKIGTIYKSEGKEPALEFGICWAQTLIPSAIISCTYVDQSCLSLLFSGGMRSRSVAWLLEFCGMEVLILKAGYKAFRSWCIAKNNQRYPFVVLGGFTGVAKTEILHALQECDETIVDLEACANHKGSAFGGLGAHGNAFSQVHFENCLAVAVWKARDAQRIWIEDEFEDRSLCHTTRDLASHEREFCCFVERKREERVSYLLQGYGSFSVADLQACAENQEAVWE